MTPASPRGKKLTPQTLVLTMVALVVCATTAAQAQSFQAQNVLVTDYVGSAGRSYPATIQYWATPGQEAILYTVPYSSSSSFLIFEDFASGLRYVACDQGCRVESLSSSSFPQLSATTAAATTRWAFGSFDRTFALPSGSQTLSARPTIPARCAASASSLALTTDPCLPYGLACGSSCICLGCTDGDDCTVDDTCRLTSFGALTCTGLESCNRTKTDRTKTVIALERERGGGSGTAVALGVALGVGIGVPLALLLLFLLCVVPLILLPLLWRRRERRPTVVRTTAAPVAAAAVPAGYAPATYMAGPGPTPVAIGNPLYAEPWRTAAMPQGVAGAMGTQAGRPAEGIVRDIPVYP